MTHDFPSAVPEIPVSDIHQAAAYYVSCLGFNKDWSGDAGDIACVSRGQCRMFLTNLAFREVYGNVSPILIWLNLSSKEEVNDLHAAWSRAGAHIVSAPESKPWKLHEFTAKDPDGNLFRVFYDFAWEERDRQPS